MACHLACGLAQIPPLEMSVLHHQPNLTLGDRVESLVVVWATSDPLLVLMGLQHGSSAEEGAEPGQQRPQKAAGGHRG